MVRKVDKVHGNRRAILSLRKREDIGLGMSALTSEAHRVITPA